MANNRNETDQYSLIFKLLTSYKELQTLVLQKIQYLDSKVSSDLKEIAESFTILVSSLP